MMKRLKYIVPVLIMTVLTSALTAQTDPSPFEFGKMWTFENPPKNWFKAAYNFDADDAWFEDVRESSLRFATWCSASFVSPNGLIMTNHHCAVPAIGDVQQEGEDLFKTGFYAETNADERRAPGLFVEQLIQVADVSQRVTAATANAENDADRQQRLGTVMAEIQEEYTTKSGWEGLRIQIVSFYSGVKYSVYGYKRYDDIRLVMLPEEDLGFFGGDPDNFTYPRYNLDCSFWRAYDTNGNPVNSSANYFKFNPDGVTEGTPVFIVGNPGSTERYRTVAQLEYDRDYRYPVQLQYLKDRYELLAKAYEKNPSADIKSDMLSYSNSIKAISGIVEGLNDEKLFGKKVAMEELIQSHAGDKDYWTRIEQYYNDLEPNLAEVFLLSPNPNGNGLAIALAHDIATLERMMESGSDQAELEGVKEQIEQRSAQLNSEEEINKFAVVLKELQMFASPDDKYIGEILDGRTPKRAASEIIDKTLFSNTDKLAKFLEKKPDKLLKKNDPLIRLSELIVPKYMEAGALYQSTSADRNNLEGKIAREVFNVFGDALPPDATFTLRISDGVVKGYEYNGTVAPYKTTYFGLYDRYYSNDMEDPWDLPKRWQNPSMELLKSPFNFVNTCDIIGGNSGSPIINMNKEAVGLVFDGNIESLPGNFIFDDEYNRSVGVHAGGIMAALMYVYNADRLVNELRGM